MSQVSYRGGGGRGGGGGGGGGGGDYFYFLPRGLCEGKVCN